MDKEYIASEYRRMHDAKKFNGDSLGMHIPEIRKLIKQHDCKTILDYGCGKAKIHKKEKLGEVTLYDPYYEPYSKKPDGTYDMVICTDVMEHIPLDDVSNVICDLAGYANKVLFLAICTKPAKKSFSNGENVHLTVKSQPWWEGMFRHEFLKHAEIKIVIHYT